MMYIKYRVENNMIVSISYIRPSDTDGYSIVEYEGDIPYCKKYMFYENNDIVCKEIDQKRDFENAIQDWLDTKAREHGYDNIISACSYAGYTNPFQDEAKRFIKWRGSVWENAYQIMQDVEDGDREPPATPQDLIGELPTFEDTTLEE